MSKKRIVLGPKVMTSGEGKNILLSCVTVAGMTLVCNPCVIFESAVGSLLCGIVRCFSGIKVRLSRMNSRANSSTVIAIKV